MGSQFCEEGKERKGRQAGCDSENKTEMRATRLLLFSFANLRVSMLRPDLRSITLAYIKQEDEGPKNDDSVLILSNKGVGVRVKATNATREIVSRGK